MNINLREEETTAYLSFYKAFLEEVQGLNRKVVDVLNGVLRESRYDELQRKISQIVDVYTETIIEDIDNGVFADWEASDGSLRACLRAYRAGEAADEVCAQIQQSMGDLLQDTLKIDKEEAVITERPIVSEDGLGQLEDICQSAQTEIQDIKSAYIAQAENKSSDNEIYGTLCPLMEGVGANLSTFFAASLESFKDLHEFIKNSSAHLRSIADDSGELGSPDDSGELDNPDGSADASMRMAGSETAGNHGADHQDMDGSGNENDHAGSEDVGHDGIGDGDIDNHDVDEYGESDSINEEDLFSGEEFNNDNRDLFVHVVEIIVRQVGADELNSSVDKHYTVLRNSRMAYAKRSGRKTASAQDIASNKYGRYIVTPKSIQAMSPACSQADAILEPIDKFYKEKFESLGKGFDKANAAIHAISSFCGLWGLGTWNLSKLFSSTDSDSSILEKVQLGGLALASCSTAGKIINGGAHMLKIMDWAMPYLKKSKLLVKLSEKVWNLTRQDIQIPYVQKMMDLYMMEHYELKHGMKGKSPYFEYYHDVATSLTDEHQRRAFESSVFAAETLMTPQNYTVHETDQRKLRAICCGVFLNLARSGMCCKKDIQSGTANDIVDKLYNIYISKESVTPRVDISPDKRVIA